MIEVGVGLDVAQAEVVELKAREANVARHVRVLKEALEPKGHTKNARPSTQQKHEQGDARRGKDKGGEKGDARRPY